jgi:hypothetical protein
MAIPVDDKDWTWVLERPCPECGLDVRSIEVGAIAGLVRENAAAWSEVLSCNADLRERPDPQRWSPLEYACHVRDVFRLYDVRLTLMLTEDDPLFANWDQNRTAAEERYGEQEPAIVRVQLQDAADRLADAFSRVEGSQWSRPGRRSDGAAFVVSSFARYCVHDPIHHLHDVTGRRS